MGACGKYATMGAQNPQWTQAHRAGKGPGPKPGLRECQCVKDLPFTGLMHVRQA